MAIDEDAWLNDVRSGEVLRQVRALHAACPCTGSSDIYERHRGLLHAMKKHPDAAVRRVAIHLEKDALELMAVEDERANGFRRNRPGGWGSAGEARRPAVRQGG